MFWYILSVIAFAAAVVLLVVARVRDTRYIKRLASETMSETVREELEEEKREIYEHRDKFAKALEDAKKNEAGGRKHEAG